MNTHPKDCLVVEDSVAGVQAASAAGMAALAFTGDEHTRPHRSIALARSGALETFDKMENLPTLLEKHMKCSARDSTDSAGLLTY
jgi:beta-phosphoglucomutase-like phosphatase (HAD superfamily)